MLIEKNLKGEVHMILFLKKKGFHFIKKKIKLIFFYFCQ